MENQSVYIAGLGVLTGVGDATTDVYHAVNADINCFDNSGYITKAHQPVRMALVPQGALPELNIDIPFSGTYSRWDKHLLQLAHGAIAEAVSLYTGDKPIPLILACPEHYPEYPHQLPLTFLSFLGEQAGVVFCPDQSRLLHTGRAGAIESIAEARLLLNETDVEYALVGGVDSFQRPELLHGLLEQGRVSGPEVMDGFTPGEGAGFILLTKDQNHAISCENYRLCVGAAGVGQELGHMYSDEPYRGDGLTQAVKNAFVGYLGPKIARIYSSMNGEGFWSKELGVAQIRNKQYLSENKPDVEHPADCFGDLGAASGAVLIALSAQQLLEQLQSQELERSTAHLICCSSDHENRSAIAIYTENTMEFMEESQ